MACREETERPTAEGRDSDGHQRRLCSHLRKEGCPKPEKQSQKPRKEKLQGSHGLEKIDSQET